MSEKGLVIVSHNNGPYEVRGRVRMQNRPAYSLTSKRGSAVGHVQHFVRDLKEFTVRWGRLS